MHCFNQCKSSKAVTQYRDRQMRLQTDIFANEDGTIPDADTAAAALLAQHHPSPAMPKNAPVASHNLQQQAFAGHPGTNSPGQPAGSGAMRPVTHEAGMPVSTGQAGMPQPQYAQYGHYTAWPGMHPGMAPQMVPHTGGEANMQVRLPLLSNSC
jgi:hypothetical protein